MNDALALSLFHALPRPAPDAGVAVPRVSQIGPIRIGIGQVAQAVTPPRARLDMAIKAMDVVRIVGPVEAMPGETVLAV